MPGEQDEALGALADEGSIFGRVARLEAWAEKVTEPVETRLRLASEALEKVRTVIEERVDPPQRRRCCDPWRGNTHRYGCRIYEADGTLESAARSLTDLAPRLERDDG